MKPQTYDASFFIDNDGWVDLGDFDKIKLESLVESLKEHGIKYALETRHGKPNMRRINITLTYTPGMGLTNETLRELSH